MKKIIISAFFLAAFLNLNAQNSSLLSNDFWKKNPTKEEVLKEINNGNSPSIANAGSFDPVTMAINNRANNEVIIAMIEMPGNGISKKTHHSRSYLHWAAATGNLELVNYLIGKGSDVHYKDSKGESITSYAAGNGCLNTDVYDALFAAGVDVNTTYNNGANLIMLVAPFDKTLSATNYFISKGLDIKQKDAHGRNVTDYAARLGNIEVMNQLISKGIKPTGNAIFFATQGSRQITNDLSFYKYLTEKLKLDPKYISHDGSTVLHHLVRKQRPEVIDYFIAQGIDLTKADNEGNTILMKAVAGNNLPFVNQLLTKVKNINALNENRQSAVMIAVENSSSEMLQTLINAGSDLSVVDKNGNNLMYYLFNSAKDQDTSKKPSALDEKANKDFQTKTELLKSNGYDFSKIQKDGSNLYHLAIAKENLVLVTVATRLGAQINGTDQEGMSALHKAALTAKNDKILKKLIALGANKDLKNELDETAYDIAVENEYLKNNQVSVEFLK